MRVGISLLCALDVIRGDLLEIGRWYKCRENRSKVNELSHLLVSKSM